MTLPTKYTHCPYCGRELDPSKAVVVVGSSGGPTYEPFMEDWRGGLVEMAHPACFIGAEGLDAFLALLAVHAEGQREYIAQLRAATRRL